MEPKFNTSFIPKKSLQADVSNTSSNERFVGRRSVQGPGFYLSVLVFVIVLILSAGVFGYTKIVENSIEQMIKSLEEQKSSFSIESIDTLLKADTHLANVETLLNRHVAVSEVFDLFEKITLKRVQYTEMEYEGQPSENPVIFISGLSKSFQEVALQMEQYRTSPVLRSPVVKELERDEETDTVSFEVEVTADQRLVSFSDALKSNRLNTVVTREREVVPEVTAQDVPKVEETSI
jgi:Fimbrial assembly protein (PilN)